MSKGNVRSFAMSAATTSTKKNKNKVSSKNYEEEDGPAALFEHEDDSIKSSATNTTATPGYQSIVQFQEPQGHFTSLPSKHKVTIENIPKTKIEEISKNPDEIDQIWLTILAVLILKKEFSATKDEWAMISKKAMSYLKKHTQKGFNIDEFESYLA